MIEINLNKTKEDFYAFDRMKGFVLWNEFDKDMQMFDYKSLVITITQRWVQYKVKTECNAMEYI